MKCVRITIETAPVVMFSQKATGGVGDSAQERKRKLLKLSCLPVSLFPQLTDGSMTLPDWFALASDCGLNGVDISMSFLHSHAAAYLRQMREMLEAQPLPVVMCTTYPDFTHPDREQRRRELLYFLSDMALCSQLGIEYLRVLAGQAHPETNVDDGIRWAVENIRRCADYADTLGIKLVYEDHGKPGAWDYIDMTFQPERFLRVVDGIWDTPVGINFDIGNIVAAGEDPLPVLEKVCPKVETIHVTDMAAWGRFEPVAIGTGVVPLKDSFHYLKANGFGGWVSIEEASGRGETGIREAVAYTRRLWDEA